MVKKDVIWVLCSLYCDENNETENSRIEDTIFKVIESSNTPLSTFIKEEFEKKAMLLYGKVYKTILFSHFYIIYANTKLKIFIIRTSNKYKREVTLLTHFVKICDCLMVKVLYIGVTLCKCKRFLKDLLIKLKIEDNIPNILKELENCS